VITSEIIRSAMRVRASPKGNSSDKAIHGTSAAAPSSLRIHSGWCTWKSNRTGSIDFHLASPS
jgi:hypothetical protein